MIDGSSRTMSEESAILNEEDSKIAKANDCVMNYF